MDGDVVRMYGIPFPTRATIVELSGGGLWMHSPVSPTAERIEAADALGEVRHLVGPNKFHQLSISSWKKRCPEATVWGSPGMLRRHPDFPLDATLEDGAPAQWGGDVRALVFRGSWFLDEVVFYVPRTKTLILTDLIQRHDPSENGWFWRLAKGLVGVMGTHGGTARDLRVTFRDREAAASCARTILSWDFDQVIISHGHCIRENAKAVVRRAFGAWLSL